MTTLSAGSVLLLQNKLSVVALWSTLLAGCATMSLTGQSTVSQYDAVTQLSDGLEDAKERDAALLAPNTFANTMKHLANAFDYARNADKQRAHETAQKGLETLRELDEAIANNAQEMEEVLDIRGRSNMQGAAALFKKQFEAADENFRVVSRLLEQDKIEDARKLRPGLIDQYEKLELSALTVLLQLEHDS